MLERTSTEYAPWHVIPCEALEGLDLSWPPADFDVEAEKKRLAST